MKITPSSKVLFIRECDGSKCYGGKPLPYMGCNNWKYLGERIYADTSKMIEDGYYYGIEKNSPEHGVKLDIFEKCCSIKLRVAIKSQRILFSELVEIIVIYGLKNKKGLFCLQEEAYAELKWVEV